MSKRACLRQSDIWVGDLIVLILLHDQQNRTKAVVSRETEIALPSLFWIPDQRIHGYSEPDVEPEVLEQTYFGCCSVQLWQWTFLLFLCEKFDKFSAELNTDTEINSPELTNGLGCLKEL